MSLLRSSSSVVLVAALALLSVACPGSQVISTTHAVSDTSWLPAASSLIPDGKLDEAAAVLCARDTDAVVDDDVRAAAGVWEGRVVGVVASSRAQAIADTAALFADQGLTHVGVAEGSSSNGNACIAVVGSRRLLDVMKLPKLLSKKDQPQTLTVSLPRQRGGYVFVQGPDGFVDRLPLDGSGMRQELTLPFRREGRHIVEVLVDDVDGDGAFRGAPEVALLWPFVRGQIGAAVPTPEVLFPDEGHDDQALTYRAEALVQRLRNEHLLEPVKISPALGEVAKARAVAITSEAALGHRVDGKDPRTALRERFGDEPRAQFIRLAEVQARGSTLKDAWNVLVDSPAHRFELVSMGVTHAGVAVVRGEDALHRPTVTLVALLGRRPPTRDPTVVQQKLLDDVNKQRTAHGFAPLVVSDSLDSAAKRLAN
ncbi:MAG TPA: CAP domain-containing protein, partial [Myxococcota bacterium]